VLHQSKGIAKAIWNAYQDFKYAWNDFSFLKSRYKKAVALEVYKLPAYELKFLILSRLK